MTKYSDLNLRQLREAKKLTQRQAAAKAGCGAEHICRWETKAREPSLENMERLAKAYGVDIGVIAKAALNTKKEYS